MAIERYIQGNTPLDNKKGPRDGDLCGTFKVYLIGGCVYRCITGRAIPEYTGRISVCQPQK